MDELIITSKSIFYTLTTLTFKEDDVFVSFCPSLDIAGYGKTQKKAMQSLEFIIKETLDFCRKEKTLKKYLTELGWLFKD